MKTRDKLVGLLKKNGPTSIHDISLKLKISRQYLHRILTELEEKGQINRLGKPPHVYYQLIENEISEKPYLVSFEQEQFLNKHFFLVDAFGNGLVGPEAMHYWCERQQLPFIKTVEEFIETRTKYLSFVDEHGLIDGLPKLLNTKGIEQIGVDQLFYLDFYAIERFGKTRLGTLMHFAKQGQNKAMMKTIVSEIRQRIVNLIDSQNVDSILFVPPTISRKIQIMSVLRTLLKLNLPEVKVNKIKTNIIIPQKALSKLFERVANAKNTFIVPEQTKYQHVLIIDDAIGSGATINEIAIKLKQKNIAQKITGIAISGSYKGFEVISEL